MILLLLASCLLLMEAPPTCPETCDGHFACDDVLGCGTTCSRDNDCEDGYFCTYGGMNPQCKEACRDGDCPGGFSCWYNDQCNDFCIDDSDCAEGYSCCDYDDRCPDSQWNNCLAD